MQRADLSNKNLVVDILAKSFMDNKSVNYVVKQDSRKAERIRKLMQYSFNMCYTFGEVWLSDNHQGSALILFPDKKRTSFRSILWDARLAVSAIGASRVLKIMKREQMIKQHHPGHPFAYLWFIGVNPEEQGKGTGTKFINEIIRHCENKKRSIYLETSMEKNIEWYKKAGFEIFHTLDLSYRLYFLRRS